MNRRLDFAKSDVAGVSDDVCARSNDRINLESASRLHRVHFPSSTNVKGWLGSVLRPQCIED